jgi:hypothetical protein
VKRLARGVSSAIDQAMNLADVPGSDRTRRITMKPFSAFILLVTLAACGADGLPVAPAAQSSSGSGITVTGCASAGVTLGAPSVDGPVRC